MSQTNSNKLVALASSAGVFNHLIAAVKAAGLAETLPVADPLTAFDSLDEAFAELPADIVPELLKPENKDQLIAILTYHIVAAKLMSPTANGTNPQLKVNTAQATRTPP
jgi:uncharacterized surface protein with fasciclin (FAS1) repeats